MGKGPQVLYLGNKFLEKNPVCGKRYQFRFEDKSLKVDILRIANALVVARLSRLLHGIE